MDRLFLRAKKMSEDELHQIKTSAQFYRLAEALEWATEHCCQGAPGCSEDEQTLQPMLLISSQRMFVQRGERRVGRQFVALTAEVLSSFYDSFRGDGTRHIDEIVPADAPCKLAIDCDWKVAKLGLAGRENAAALWRDLDASFAALVQRIVALIAERYAAHVEPMLTSADGVGKWSRHAVFDGALWKNNRHCAALARELKHDDVAACGGDKERSLVDQYLDVRIYDANHSLRMYRSSKPGDVERSFRRANEPISAPIDKDFLRRSMITLFPIQGTGDGQQYYITSLFARRFAERLPLALLEHANATYAETAHTVLHGPATASGPLSDVTGRLSTTHWTRQFIEAFRSMGAYEAEPEVVRGTMRLRCLNHECAIKGGRHSNENIFVQIDLIDALWRQSCFNQVCRKTPTEWQALPDELAALCSTVYDQWSGAQRAVELAVYAERLVDL